MIRPINLAFSIVLNYPGLRSSGPSEMDEFIDVNEEGFLIDAARWSSASAEAMAAQIPLVLSADHWALIHLIRSYFFRFGHLPNTRMFVKVVRKELGEEKGSSRFLHQKYGETPLKTLCRIAGLPKPPGCL